MSLGSPLSPLMGTLYLKRLDDRMAKLGCFYIRYMDDWVILAPTRWKLRLRFPFVFLTRGDITSASLTSPLPAMLPTPSLLALFSYSSY